MTGIFLLRRKGFTLESILNAFHVDFKSRLQVNIIGTVDRKAPLSNVKCFAGNRSIIPAMYFCQGT